MLIYFVHDFGMLNALSSHVHSPTSRFLLWPRVRCIQLLISTSADHARNIERGALDRGSEQTSLHCRANTVAGRQRSFIGCEKQI